MTYRSCVYYISFALVASKALGMSWPDIMRKHMLTSFADVYEYTGGAARSGFAVSTVFAPTNDALQAFITKLSDLGWNVSTPRDVPINIMRQIVGYHLIREIIRVEDFFSCKTMESNVLSRVYTPGFFPMGGFITFKSRYNPSPPHVLGGNCDQQGVADYIFSPVSGSSWPRADVLTAAVPISLDTAPYLHANFLMYTINQVLVPVEVAALLEQPAPHGLEGATLGGAQRIQEHPPVRNAEGHQIIPPLARRSRRHLASKAGFGEHSA